VRVKNREKRISLNQDSLACGSCQRMIRGVAPAARTIVGACCHVGVNRSHASAFGTAEWKDEGKFQTAASD
jgi:hypothetical protein